MQNSLFRQVALDKLSSPDNLDELVRVTDARGWISLAATSIVIAAAMAWSLFGTIRTSVPGRGVLIREGGVSRIVSNTAGRIVDVKILDDGHVNAGDVVAVIAQPDLARDLSEASATLESARMIERTAAASSSLSLSMQNEELAHRADALARENQLLEQQAAELKEKLEETKRLVASGLVIPSSVLDAQRDEQAVRLTIARNQRAIEELSGQQRVFANERGLRLQTARLAVSEAERRLLALQAKLSSAEVVRSAKSGEVLSVQAEVGDAVGVGTVLADIEPAGRRLLAAVYVAASDGRKITAGAPAQISPTEVNREEYGFVHGRVRSVSHFPATRGEMAALLSNDNLVQTLSSGGAPYQVLVDLATDPHTPSGLQWSSRRTPDIRINSGGVCAVDVIVREQRPIELLIPYIREKLGL